MVKPGCTMTAANVTRNAVSTLAAGGVIWYNRYGETSDWPATESYRSRVQAAFVHARKTVASPVLRLVSGFKPSLRCYCDNSLRTTNLPKFRRTSLFHAGANAIISLSDAVVEADRVLSCYREQCGAPAIVAAVAVDGRIVYETGIGYADVEQRVHARTDTVMRIASISKCMTAAIAACMVEREWLDLDKSIYEYIGTDTFPVKKQADGSEVEITTRQLLSHMAGIRHYRKADDIETFLVKLPDKPLLPVNISPPADATLLGKASKTRASAQGDGQYPEFSLNKQFETVSDSMEVFKNDPLLSAPGESFFYTTFGYTLLSAVLEKAAERAAASREKKPASAVDQKDAKDPTALPVSADVAVSSGLTTLENEKKENPHGFPNLFKNFIVQRLGLFHTYLDTNEKIIPNRARYYQRDSENHMLINTPEVNNSCKWAGGGILSTCGDIARFGNALLMSQQSRPSSSFETFLRPWSVRTLWQNVEKTEKGTSAYGLGFYVTPSDYWLRLYTNQAVNFPPAADTSTDDSKLFASAYMSNLRTRVVYHSGGAVGASSILAVVPRNVAESESVIDSGMSNEPHPSGVVVAIMCNLQGVSLYHQALELCRIFDAIDLSALDNQV